MATFVICHGAWSAAWAWKKVRPLLRAAGHDVFTPTCSGLGERAHQVSPSITLDTHIGDVLAMLDCEDLRDVVLVGHSYGGMVATGVADRAGERNAKVVYLDAFVPENGQSAFDLLPASARASRQEMTRTQGDVGSCRQILRRRTPRRKTSHGSHRGAAGSRSARSPRR